MCSHTTSGVSLDGFAPAANRAYLTRGGRHYREDRIRAHVQLCWLALLLMRVVENATNDTWRNVRNELDRMHLVTLATADGHVAQRTATTAGQNTILTALGLDEPARFSDFTVATDCTADTGKRPHVGW